MGSKFNCKLQLFTLLHKFHNESFYQRKKQKKQKKQTIRYLHEVYLMHRQYEYGAIDNPLNESNRFVFTRWTLWMPIMTTVQFVILLVESSKSHQQFVWLDLLRRQRLCAKSTTGQSIHSTSAIFNHILAWLIKAIEWINIWKSYNQMNEWIY